MFQPNLHEFLRTEVPKILLGCWEYCNCWQGFDWAGGVPSSATVIAALIPEVLLSWIRAPWSLCMELKAQPPCTLANDPLSHLSNENTKQLGLEGAAD